MSIFIPSKAAIIIFRLFLLSVKFWLKGNGSIFFRRSDVWLDIPLGVFGRRAKEPLVIPRFVGVLLFLTRRPSSVRVNSNAIIEKGFIVCVVLKVNVDRTVFVSL